MNLRSKVAQGLKWQAIMIGGRQVLSLVIFGILARLLDPADFGVMGLTYIYLMFAGMITDPGIGTALVQRANPEPAHWDAVFWFNVGCSLGLCVATIVLAGPIAAVCGEPKFAAVLRWSAVGMVFSAASFVHAIKFTKEIEFGRLAIPNLSAQLIGGFAGVAMAFAGYGVWALVGQQLTSSLASSALLWMTSSYRPLLRFSPPHFRDLSGVSAKVFLNNLLSLFTSRVDQLVIGRFAGTSALGLYVIAGKIPELVKMATQQPLLDVLVPAMSRLQQDPERMRDAIRRGTEMNAAVVFALYVGLALVSPDLVHILFGSKWAGAAGLCSLLSLYALIGAIHVYIYPALLALGLTGKFVALTALQAAGVVVACLVGIQFGVAYVIAGLILNSLLMIAPWFVLIQREIGLKPLDFYRSCVAPALAALAMAAVIQAAGYVLTPTWSPWLRLGCHIPLGAVVYLGLLYFLSPAILHTLMATLKQTLPAGRPAPGSSAC
jgi:O-antigen/teichoic acid export membrane protein